MALKVNFKQPTKHDRNMKICQLRMEKDMPITELAEYFGISKQRVQALLEKYLDTYIKLKKK